MAGINLVTGALPKSRAGRKAAPLDEKLVDALVKHLTDNPYIKNDDDQDRPNVAGPGIEFQTQGKAASAGRKYAEAIAKKMDKTVRVHVDSNGKNGDAARFTWVVYLPISDMPQASEDGDKS